MAGADVSRFARDRQGLTFNFLKGLVSGSLLSLADTLIHPLLILTLFVAELTDSWAAIGGVAAIYGASRFMPHLIYGWLGASRARRVPLAAASAIIRAGALVLLAYVVYRADRMAEADLLRSFFICYAAYCFAAGFANVAATDMLAQGVPASRRGALFRQRWIWGAVAALAAGLVIGRLFAEGPTFPENFALLFVTAAAAAVAGTFFLSGVREPVRVAGTRSPNVGLSLDAVGNLVADASYRRFLLFRTVLSLSALADPFLIIYAQRELDIPLRMVGPYLLALIGAQLLAALIWVPVRARIGTRALLQGAALLRLLVPLIAVTLPFLAATPLYEQRVTDERVLFYAFGLVYWCYGLALGIQSRANVGYLLEVADPQRQTAAISLTNIVLGVTALAPLAAARLIERYELDGLLVIAATVGLLGVLLSGTLTDAGAQPQRHATAWRLRRASRRPSQAEG